MLHVVTSDSLFTKDLESVQDGDLKPGEDFMMEFDKKFFPVTYLKGLYCTYSTTMVQEKAVANLANITTWECSCEVICQNFPYQHASS